MISFLLFAFPKGKRDANKKWKETWSILCNRGIHFLVNGHQRDLAQRNHYFFLLFFLLEKKKVIRWSSWSLCRSIENECHAGSRWSNPSKAWAQRLIRSFIYCFYRHDNNFKEFFRKFLFYSLFFFIGIFSYGFLSFLWPYGQYL